MKTLSIFTGGIGDLLLAGPAFAQLHEQGPLDLAGIPERLALIQAASACDAIHNLDRIDFHSLFERPSPKLRDFIQPYNRVIVWMRDDGTIEKALRKIGVPDVQVHPGIPPDDWTRHASEYYLHCIDAEANRPPLRIAQRERGPSAMPKYDAIIHPGSGSPKKNWPIENFIAVAEHLQREGRRVSWTRGPAEEELRYPANAEIVEANTLVDFAQHLARADLYIGNDSGITHLAAAVGCTTIAIFGPTNPTVWAPRGDHVSKLSGAPWPSRADALAVLHG